MNGRRARRPVTRREAGGRRPLTTAAFAPITGEPFPLVTAVSSHREAGMGHPDAVRPPAAVSPVDYRSKPWTRARRRHARGRYHVARLDRPATVLVSPDEYDGWKETQAIRSDREFMAEIRRRLRALRCGGKIYTLEEILPEE